MIKIGIDITDLKYAQTGQKTYLESIIKTINKKNSYEFEFIYFSSPFPNLKNKNIFYSLINHLLLQLWKQIILPIKLILNRCEIVFITDYYVPLIHYKFKSIQVIHDAFFFEYPNHYNKYWLIIYRLFSLPGVYKSTYIITPTEYSKKQLLKYFRLSQEKIFVISEGPKLFNNQINEDHLNNDLKIIISSYKYFLHVGVFEKRKNLLFLIKAFNEFIQNGNTSYKLVIVGKGTNRKESDETINILNLISDLELKDFVILTGYLSDNELEYVYKNAFAYIFPSYNEGFGLPILEAFQFDLPVLASDNSCLPEVGGNAVLYFNPFDEKELVKSLEIITTDESLRKELILKGRERLKLYSWEATVDNLFNIFNKTII
jgi:glycosyltransferase involved in cell wall biosynthesis